MTAWVEKIPVLALQAAIVLGGVGHCRELGGSGPIGAIWAAEAKSPPPAKPGTPAEVRERIAQLVAQLGDKDYSVRQRAQDELAKLGFLAFDALTAASNHEDFEIASRARYLLRLIRSQWTTEKDPLEVRQILEGYELQGHRERANRIFRLVRLPHGIGVPVVCRLIRFERSELLSDQAAMEILNHEPLDRAGWSRLAQMLRDNLGGSPRPAARWLTVYVQLREHPQTAVEQWSRLAEAEEQAFKKTPERSVPGSAAMLTYLLAGAQARLGSQAKAEETAQRARQLGGTNEPTQLRVRLQTAFALRRRGWFAWAEAEYRRVAEGGPTDHKVFALVHLSEMLHDQGRDERAANARRQALDVIEHVPAQRRGQLNEQLDRNGLEPSEIAARMNYFLACHWESKGDRAKQREFLEKAVRANAEEVDTLIALFQLPGGSPAERAKTNERVKKAVDALRRELSEETDEANAYNQVAWLMGNTQGDLKEALEMAKKAVELAPENDAYLDTLAHVYYARGDYANAVRYQSQAAEINPHSGLIVKELKAFRAAMEQKRGGKTTSGPDRKG